MPKLVPITPEVEYPVSVISFSSKSRSPIVLGIVDQNLSKETPELLDQLLQKTTNDNEPSNRFQLTLLAVSDAERHYADHGGPGWRGEQRDFRWMWLAA